MPGALDRLTERFTAAMAWGLPGWSGDAFSLGPFTPGLRGTPRPVPWDVFASAVAPEIPGAEVHFAASGNHRPVSQENVSPEALAPLVRVLRAEVEGPFVAIAVRDEGDTWCAGANRAHVIELPGARGEQIEVSRIGGQLTALANGAESSNGFPPLERLLEGDQVVIAHRFVGSTWVAETFPL